MIRVRHVSNVQPRLYARPLAGLGQASFGSVPPPTTQVVAMTAGGAVVLALVGALVVPRHRVVGALVGAVVGAGAGFGLSRLPLIAEPAAVQVAPEPTVTMVPPSIVDGPSAPERDWVAANIPSLTLPDRSSSSASTYSVPMQPLPAATPAPASNPVTSDGTRTISASSSTTLMQPAASSASEPSRSSSSTFVEPITQATVAPSITEALQPSAVLPMMPAPAVVEAASPPMVAPAYTAPKAMDSLVTNPVSSEGARRIDAPSAPIASQLTAPSAQPVMQDAIVQADALPIVQGVTAPQVAPTFIPSAPTMDALPLVQGIVAPSAPVIEAQPMPSLTSGTNVTALPLVQGISTPSSPTLDAQPALTMNSIKMTGLKTLSPTLKTGSTMTLLKGFGGIFG